ncbi:MAG: ABC transporter permease [Bacteroidales bacterium]
MKQFFVFVRKEFLHISRDVRTILILLLMPIVQIVLFGFALTNEVQDVKVLFISNESNETAALINHRILSSPYFIPVDTQASATDAESLMKSNQVSLIVNYSRNFNGTMAQEGAGQIELIADGSDPNMASAILMYSSAIIAESLADRAPVSLKGQGQVSLSTELLYNPQMKSSYNFVPGVMGLILMIICAMMTSISIVREKETGTMEILLVSPIRPMFIILSKSVPYFILSVINLATILLLSVYVLKVPVTGSLFWLVMVSFIFIFVSLTLGLLISSITHTQVAAMLISGLALMMPAMLLSGMIFPISNMPELLQVFTKFVPATWYILAVKKLMIQGLPLSSVVTEIAAMCAMAAVFLALSLKQFKYRLE